MPKPAIFFTALIFLLLSRASVLGLELHDLQVALQHVLDSDTTARRTTVALQVVDLATGKVLFDRHGDKLLTPASNLKIYTSACALDTFGPEHQFSTQISARVAKKAGTIHGDLRIVGCGNAMLSTDELKNMAGQMVDEWKVHTLQGKVVADNSRYSNTQLGPGWMWDDQPYYFNMRITPLMIDFNVVTVSGSNNENSDPKRQAVDDPAGWAATLFSKMLTARGVNIVSGRADQTVGSMRTLTQKGAILADTLRHFNHKSENAVGEVLLHEIAIDRGAKKPTWSDGAKVIIKWLHESAGLEKGSFRLVDGSGLSRYNLISADSSVKLLAYMHRHRHYQTFFDSLPSYEVNVGRGKSRKLVRAKSGGMSGVSTISGYVRTVSGRQLAFSLLGNGFIGSNKPMRALRGKVWQVLIQYEDADGR